MLITWIQRGGPKIHTIFRWHFELHFILWKLLCFDENFNEIYLQRSDCQYPSIGSENGLAPNRWQAITWTNDGLVYWHIYASLGLNESNKKKLIINKLLISFGMYLTICGTTGMLHQNYNIPETMHRKNDDKFILNGSMWYMIQWCMT